MGKRIIAQSRGKGSPTYTAPSHKFKANLEHLKVQDGIVTGTVRGIEHDPARSAPIGRISFSNGEERLMLIPEGTEVGQVIQCGISAPVEPGNTLNLAEIPEGMPICNIEGQPGDGGKFARASGMYGILIAHDVKKTVVQMPSGAMKRLHPMCRAVIGVVAGGGRTEKPFVKAGKKFHRMAVRARKWPRSRGVAMNVVDHPFGGGGWQHPGKPKTVARGAPPGQKVGSIAARRTGKR
ncbi:MAG: 50S ribosomal protein L2 [Candidatus Methanoperedens sp.]|jgi:large subunit ribosomal protein L2|nr:50S ribosomal protein L2 [Candidatus Methanoperedens sp.]PKL54417.1 MAG: 50S ribosomal protein L2 [Candidatus Methanoperedenaceae archaeon HGW-Methanoperedenaceae-1]